VFLVYIDAKKKLCAHCQRLKRGKRFVHSGFSFSEELTRRLGANSGEKKTSTVFEMASQRQRASEHQFTARFVEKKEVR